MAEVRKRVLPLLEGDCGRDRLDRFWAKVEKRSADDCWPWTASLDTYGYGRFKIASYEQVTASRVALIAATGDEPDGLHALHSCDNPRCCNPSHLRWGTMQDNMIDKIERGRDRRARRTGFRNPGAKLTPELLAAIVAGFIQGLSDNEIAAAMPIGPQTVRRIRIGRTFCEETAALGYSPTRTT